EVGIGRIDDDGAGRLLRPELHHLPAELRRQLFDIAFFRLIVRGQSRVGLVAASAQSAGWTVIGLSRRTTRIAWLLCAGLLAGTRLAVSWLRAVRRWGAIARLRAITLLIAGAGRRAVARLGWRRVALLGARVWGRGARIGLRSRRRIDRVLGAAIARRIGARRLLRINAGRRPQGALRITVEIAGRDIAAIVVGPRRPRIGARRTRVRRCGAARLIHEQVIVIRVDRWRHAALDVGGAPLEEGRENLCPR